MIPVIRRQSPGAWPKKNQKKVRKKLASAGPFPLDRTSERQIPHFAVQKKFGKSEKKACQHSRN
jgi:hypothetical protein